MRLNIKQAAFLLLGAFALFLLGYVAAGQGARETFTISGNPFYPPDEGMTRVDPPSENPAPEESPERRSADQAAANPAMEERWRININTASADELADLPGIGPALAGRIVSYREQNGPFATLTDIQNVRGIGPAIYEKLAPYATIDT